MSASSPHVQGGPLGRLGRTPPVYRSALDSRLLPPFGLGSVTRGSSALFLWLANSPPLPYRMKSLALPAPGVCCQVRDLLANCC
jgi:hypothetical protein